MGEEEDQVQREEEESECVNAITDNAMALHEDHGWSLDDIIAHLRSVIREGA